LLHKTFSSLEPPTQVFLFLAREAPLIQTYKIIGSSMVIPGIPGEFHAGQEIDIDTDENKVVATRLLAVPPADEDQIITSRMLTALLQSTRPSIIGAEQQSSPVAVKRATDNKSRKVDK
jgi:hypothetical protein